MDLKKTVKSYLLDKNSEFAILINGDWGSGKTHFWRNYIRAEITAISSNPIYISLYSNSSESVKNHIISEIIANSASGQNSIGQVISKIGASIGKIISKTNYQELFEAAVFNNYDFSKSVICFDDLERTSIEMKEVLGFINELVANKKAKVFILTNEKYIKEKSGFNLVKEKTIGRTLNYKAVISEIFDELLKATSNDSAFHKYISEDKEFFINLTSEYKIQNLRTIKFSINYLFIIFTEGKNDIELLKKVRKQVILFSLIITNEYCEGRLTSGDFENPKGIDEIDNSFHGKMFKPSISSFLANQYGQNPAEPVVEEEQPYSIEFYNRYLEREISLYTFFKSIYQLIVGGSFDYSLFKTEIDKIKEPPPDKESIQKFQQLINYSFRELKDDEFINLTEEVLKYIEQGEYPIYQYSQLGNYFYFFSKQGLIKTKPAELQPIFEKGLEKSKAITEAHEFSMEQMLHFRGHNEEVEALKKKIKTIHEELIALKLKEELNQFIASINDGHEKMEEGFKKFFAKPIFNIIDIDLLSKTILETSNKNIWWFTGEFEKRYNSGGINEFHKADKDGLTLFRDKLKAVQIDKESLPLRNHLLTILIEVIDGTAKKLE